MRKRIKTLVASSKPTPPVPAITSGKECECCGGEFEPADLYGGYCNDCLDEGGDEDDADQHGLAMYGDSH